MERMQKQLREARTEGMKMMSKAIVVDFKPLLCKVKKLIDNNVSKDKIVYEIDAMLGLIAQLEKFGGTISKE